MRIPAFFLAAVLAWLLLAVPATAAPKAWVVRDGDTEITLFGTIHALPKGTEWLSPAVAQRLDTADTLVLEAVLPDDPQALMPLIARVGMRPGLKPLAQRVPADALPKLTAAAVAAGVPMATLDRMESWLAAVTLGDAALAGIGVSSDSGVEPVLTARVKKRGRPVIGLETVEEQLHFFDGLSQADQTAMLLSTIDEVATAKANMASVTGLWQAGDVDAIARDFDTETRGSPLLRQRLLVGRNTRWADWIVGLMRQPGKTFIAVGAGHLGGPDGLLALLRARGLAVEAVG
ncbi:TraB/GumN family protein [Polymorphobacter fuscus]|uniref:TraB/GumN family protein n=1 Tax=Sandarakinorhabdus fusca TaxID=1439888 RepID=A0A7C9KJQ7_9SPHN|nr:TraB/GumN family protein [Polymorphobacter fuscus]KAB7644115.1 TraB/GumN family protein [Polymorphobacter fuscus]MQT18500.1 TraB/GumN family protein [Polymorphobacter fuscus]NJC08378.1 hypothetical protein [Polymorphobacter fuscus]